MLPGVLLHVVAPTSYVDHSPDFNSRRQNLRDLMPHFAKFILEYVVNCGLERHSRFGFGGETASVERLATTGRIKSGSIKLHRPGGVIAISLEFLSVRNSGPEVVEKGVAVVEAFGHDVTGNSSVWPNNAANLAFSRLFACG